MDFLNGIRAKNWSSGTLLQDNRARCQDGFGRSNRPGNCPDWTVNGFPVGFGERIGMGLVFKGIWGLGKTGIFESRVKLLFV